MDFNYISTKEAAKILGVTERYIQMLCKKGKIEGAIKFNGQGVWLVPKNTIVHTTKASDPNRRNMRREN